MDESIIFDNQNNDMSSDLIAKILDHIGVINLGKIDPKKIDAKLLSTRGKKDIALKDGVLI